MSEPPRSNKEWEYWGKHDPMFGVLTLPGREKSGGNPWTVEEVLEQGRAYFADVLPHWQQYGMQRRHCIEIGCGTGRLTRQLVDHFDRVTAVDVSADQLASARLLLGDQTNRVALMLVAAPLLPVPDGVADGVFTCEVFQHFDSDTPVFSYLRESYRALAPGGTTCFQVPLKGVTPDTALSSHWRTLLLRVARVLGRRRMMIYRRYDARVMLRTLEEIGFVRVQLRVIRSVCHGGFESYFFATRP